MKRLHEKIAIIHLLLMQSTGLHGLECATPEERKEIEGCNLRDYMDWNGVACNANHGVFCDAIYGIAWIGIEEFTKDFGVLIKMQSTGLHGLEFIVCVHFLTSIWMQSTGLHGLE